MHHVALAYVLLAQVGSTLPQDSVDTLRKQARAAESRYERISRSRAPFVYTGGGSAPCDEVVGRFCLRFDSLSKPPDATEHAEVGRARANAIESLRRYFGAVPGTLDAAGPLVRLLVLDQRATEAVSAARAFGSFTRDSLWAHLLGGYAEHAAGLDSAAETSFTRALLHMPVAERTSWVDPEWLLDPRERAARRRLDDAARAEYDRRLWLLSDPFWMTTPNEFRTEHIARRVEAALLEEVPLVAGMLAWGRDLDELTVRYGVPVARARSPQMTFGAGLEMIEYYDTAQRAYAPASGITTGFAAPPAPGERPAFYAASARSAFAVHTVPRVLHLDHQATRFVRDGRIVLRVDGVVTRDTVRDAGRASSTGSAALIVYDSALVVRNGVDEPLEWQGDSARVSLLAEAPHGSLYYSVEAMDTTSRAAARARYHIAAEVAEGITLSDLLLCAPFGAALPQRHDDPLLSPLTSLVVMAGDTLGIYAELYGNAGALDVEMSLTPRDGPSLIGRAARWLGRTARIIGAESHPRVAWRMEAATSPRIVALNLPINAPLRGAYIITLSITDPATRTVTRSTREILVER